MFTTTPACVLHTATHYSRIPPPGSAVHQEACRFQAEVFSRALRSRSQSYLETVDFAPEHTIPITVWQQHSDQLVGTIRLEKPAYTMIESVVRFIPNSLPARSLREGRVLEMGGFATLPGMEREEILDVLDVMAATIVHITEQQIDWLWLLPRRRLMSLLRADIPSLLPPYHFALSREVLGWNEDSDRLRQLRDLHVKGFYIQPDDPPGVYTIPWQTLAHDLMERMALHEERHQCSELLPLLSQAMRRANQHTLHELGVCNVEGNTHDFEA